MPDQSLHFLLSSDLSTGLIPPHARTYPLIFSSATPAPNSSSCSSGSKRGRGRGRQTVEWLRGPPFASRHGLPGVDTRGLPGVDTRGFPGVDTRGFFQVWIRGASSRCGTPSPALPPTPLYCHRAMSAAECNISIPPVQVTALSVGDVFAAAGGAGGEVQLIALASEEERAAGPSEPSEQQRAESTAKPEGPPGKVSEPGGAEYHTHMEFHRTSHKR